MYGTLINTAAVIVGSLLGLIIHTKLPQRITTIAFQAIGLFTLYLGFSMASNTGNVLVLIFSIIIGSILGELLDIDATVSKLGERIKLRIKSKNDKFVDGLVTSFLMFCMGSMTILGSIEEGLGGAPDLLMAKSVLDGFASIALSASLGIGVLFSAVLMLIYQGGLTLGAHALQNVFSEVMINEISAVGGLMLIGLGISILDIKKLKILNMVPSLLIAGVLALVFLS